MTHLTDKRIALIRYRNSQTSISCALSFSSHPPPSRPSTSPQPPLDPDKAAPYNCASLPKTPPRTSVFPPAPSLPNYMVWPGGASIHGFSVCPSASREQTLIRCYRRSRGAGGIWGEATQRAGRALVETRVGNDSEDGGMKTNEGVGRRVGRA
ncbi:hypothetical protein FIBSPDRAFT_25888 [Athelia psychrophila]|uniref:Uncharacterized protein n=1 Tax=Athelia psychrophila TaxID=1759441 RepID=A0A166G9W0_9AGAM|nr:hypothetical protein FIBSPDRAFT_25888 [Fibularhizoctonia sp. CBS 109695]